MPLIRIVRMHIKQESIDDFQKIYHSYQDQISNFSGCQHLELWQDLDHINIFTTYSIWDQPSSLNAYRKSEIFTKVWSIVKPLFELNAQAWSMQKL